MRLTRLTLNAIASAACPEYRRPGLVQGKAPGRCARDCAGVLLCRAAECRSLPAQEDRRRPPGSYRCTRCSDGPYLLAAPAHLPAPRSRFARIHRQASNGPVHRQSRVPRERLDESGDSRKSLSARAGSIGEPQTSPRMRWHCPPTGQVSTDKAVRENGCSASRRRLRNTRSARWHLVYS